MDYKKKLKQRLFVNLSWAVLGLGLLLYWFLAETDNTYPLSLGTAFIFIGIVRTIQYKQTTADEKVMREKEIAENDERNRMMQERAKSWAFSFSIIAAGILVIVLNLLGYHDEALPFAWYVCGMTLLYWICWNIIRKKY